MTFGWAPAAVVVDASVAVAIVTGDDAWSQIARGWADEGMILVAPHHFHAEVANALLKSRGMEPNEIETALRRLERLGIDQVDRGFDGLIEAVRFGARHRLTVYDALYLALALEVDGEIATGDAELIRAAAAESVRVVSARRG